MLITASAFSWIEHTIHDRIEIGDGRDVKWIWHVEVTIEVSKLSVTLSEGKIKLTH